MKHEEIMRLNMLSGAIISADRQIADAVKPFKPGCGNMPTIGLAYDQSEASNDAAIVELREQLKKKMVEAYREYRKGVLKLLEEL